MGMVPLGAGRAFSLTSARLAALRALELYRDLLFAFHEFRRDPIFGIEETHRAAPLNRLFANAGAIHKDFKFSFVPFVVVVGHHERHGLGRVHRHIEREPLRAAASGSALQSQRFCVFTLHVRIAFGLHFAGLHIGHSGSFQLLLAFTLSGQRGCFLLPLCRREQVAIDGVSAAVQPVKRHEINIALTADAIRVKHAGLICNGFEPLRDRAISGDVNRGILQIG